jgi:hypothetical protein
VEKSIGRGMGIREAHDGDILVGGKDACMRGGREVSGGKKDSVCEW